MTQNEIKKEQNDLLDVFCEDMIAYLTTADAEKLRNMRALKRHFHEMMESLLVDMFDRKIRNVLMANIQREVAEKTENVGSKVEAAAEARALQAEDKLKTVIRNFNAESKAVLQRANDISNQADVSKIKGIIEGLIGDAEASRNKLEASKQQIEKRVDALLQMTPISESIRATFVALKEQGVEVSSPEAAEIVKAIAEYQGKIVEKESYGDWIKTREAGLSERKNNSGRW